MAWNRSDTALDPTWNRKNTNLFLLKRRNGKKAGKKGETEQSITVNKERKVKSKNEKIRRNKEKNDEWK